MAAIAVGIVCADLAGWHTGVCFFNNNIATNILFFILYRIYGKIKVLRALTKVKAHLRQHPDPRVDYSKFNTLAKYFEATPLHEALARERKAADTAEPLIDDDVQDNVVQKSIPDFLCGWGFLVTKADRILEYRYLNLGRKMELDIANTDVGEVRLNLCCIYA
jgi:hypothetical protein